MKEPGFRLLLFIVISFLSYLSISILLSFAAFESTIFLNVNLVSDIYVNKVNKSGAKDSIAVQPPHVKASIGNKSFVLFRQARVITDFSIDNTAVTLPHFIEKLYRLKTTKKGKVRIAYFGDSMIEGDLMTSTIRKMMQNEFGGAGVGFVPVKTPSSNFSSSFSNQTSTGWTVESFKTKPKTNLFLSGYCYFPQSNDYFQLTDYSLPDTSVSLSKYLFYGHKNGGASLIANGKEILLSNDVWFHKALLERDEGKIMRISGMPDDLPVFGLSFETDDGVIVDNFSFRGITGIELNQLSEDFLRQVAAKNNYDLVIFQYGVNMLFRPNDKNFKWYKRAFSPVIGKFKSCFPDCDILMISSADRAFRYNGKYESAVGIDSLICIQAEIAYENNTAFYNQFLSMGGRGSIVSWADSIPSLANKDYVHPNRRGAEKLASFIYEALLQDYGNFIKIQQKKPGL